MKNQALFSWKGKRKKLKCCLLQFLIGALRVNSVETNELVYLDFCCLQIKQYFIFGTFSIKSDSNIFATVCIESGAM